MKNRLLEMGIDEESCNKILEMFNKSIEEKDREIADIKLNYEIENVLNSYSVKTNKAVKALLIWKKLNLMFWQFPVLFFSILLLNISKILLQLSSSIPISKSLFFKLLPPLL